MARKKITLKQAKGMTLGEGCKRFLLDCKARNLREDSIKHYHYSFAKVLSFFDEDMPLSDFNEQSFNDYKAYLQDSNINDQTVWTYLKGFSTLIHFLEREGEVKPFDMKHIKVDKHPVETYTDEELRVLLKKPNIKQCDFLEYESWVMCNFLLVSGLRQKSLINIRVRDLDLSSCTLSVMHTKNRKSLIIPLNSSVTAILREFLKYRNPKNEDDVLFCNSFGEPLTKSNHYRMMYLYNKRRGIERVGLHRWRHTMAKNWILNNGNVVTLSRLLGHSSLSTTQNYINLLVSDLAKDVEEIDLISKYSSRKSIKMK